MTRKVSLQTYRASLIDRVSSTDYRIFLCGPNVGNIQNRLAAQLRVRIQNECEKEGFEVHLGEDDGLDSLREFGLLADQNEVQFIKEVANAIVLIGSSVGSFCELGLFAQMHVQQVWTETDFILILDEEYKNHLSYLNLGPVGTISNSRGLVFHCDFAKFDIQMLISRLKKNRAMLATPILR